MSVGLQIVIFVAFGFIAYRSAWLALLLVLVISCSFGFVSELASIELNPGNINLTEIVVLVLLVRTIRQTPPTKNDPVYTICLLLIGWLTISAILSVIAGDAGGREAYRIVMKIAVFWIIPITVREFSGKQKRRLMLACFFLASAVSAIQLYSMLTENTALLAFLYPESMSTAYGYQGAGEYYSAIFRRGDIPRIYTPVNIITKMVFASAVCLLAMRAREMRRTWLWVPMTVTGMFTIYLGGRSDSVALVVTIIMALWVVYTTVEVRMHRKIIGILMVPIVAIVVIASIQSAGEMSELRVFDNVIERWGTLPGGGIVLDTRLEDTLEAWDYLLASPLWGIGRHKVHWEPTMITYGGQDVHPFVCQGLIGGFPAIILVLLLFWMVFREWLSRIRDVRTKGQSDYLAMAAGPALIVGVVLSAINTTNVLMYANAQVPLGIYLGLVLRHDERDERVSRASEEASTDRTLSLR